METTQAEICPCGSGLNYESCCKPYHQKDKLPVTAEALMRSRYSAYAKGEIDYLFITLHPKERTSVDLQSAKEWSDSAEWLGLEIIDSRGGEHDTQGFVEFIAKYSQDGVAHSHHERSTFKKFGKRWFFSDGKIVGAATEDTQVSRNALCPCGSGKKFKRCCAGAR